MWTTFLLMLITVVTYADLKAVPNLPETSKVERSEDNCQICGPNADWTNMCLQQSNVHKIIPRCVFEYFLCQQNGEEIQQPNGCSEIKPNVQPVVPESEIVRKSFIPKMTYHHNEDTKFEKELRELDKQEEEEACNKCTDTSNWSSVCVYDEAIKMYKEIPYCVYEMLKCQEKQLDIGAVMVDINQCRIDLHKVLNNDLPIGQNMNQNKNRKRNLHKVVLNDVPPVGQNIKEEILIENQNKNRKRNYPSFKRNEIPPPPPPKAEDIAILK